MRSKKILLGLLAIALVFGMIVAGCENGTSNSGSSSKGDIKVFAPTADPITQITIKNSSGKIVKTDTSRISAKGWRSYSVAAGSYTVQATIKGVHKTGYATVTAGNVATVRF